MRGGVLVEFWWKEKGKDWGGGGWWTLYCRERGYGQGGRGKSEVREREKGGGLCWSEGVIDCTGSRKECGNGHRGGLRCIAEMKTKPLHMYKIYICGYKGN